MSGDFLTQMAEASRMRVAAARRHCSYEQLRQRAMGLSPAPALRRSTHAFDVIAEVKLRSPAVGLLEGGDTGVVERVVEYAQAGAMAVSVLTEPSRFDGALEHLTRAAAALGTQAPAMRKDFLVDPYQVYEARVAGAGGVLVILRMLQHAEQHALLEAAAELHLFALLEAFDEPDLRRAAALVADYGKRLPLLVGINCRDLTSLQVVPGRLESLSGALPPGVPHVAESGVQTAADAARLAALGYDVALVGSALMRADDPAALLRAMLVAGRGSAG